MLFAVSGVDVGCNRNPAEATLMEQTCWVTASIATVYTFDPRHVGYFFSFFLSRSISVHFLLYCHETKAFQFVLILFLNIGPQIVTTFMQ